MIFKQSERTSSDNVEAVKSPTDNPKQACPGLALPFQEAEHGGSKLQPRAPTLCREDTNQPQAWSLEQGAEGGDPGHPARWHVQLQSGRGK